MNINLNVLVLHFGAVIKLLCHWILLFLSTKTAIIMKLLCHCKRSILPRTEVSYLGDEAGFHYVNSVTYYEANYSIKEYLQRLHHMSLSPFSWKVGFCVLCTRGLFTDGGGWGIIEMTPLTHPLCSPGHSTWKHAYLTSLTTNWSRPSSTTLMEPALGNGVDNGQDRDSVSSTWIVARPLWSCSSDAFAAWALDIVQGRTYAINIGSCNGYQIPRHSFRSIKALHH